MPVKCLLRFRILRNSAQGFRNCCVESGTLCSFCGVCSIIFEAYHYIIIISSSRQCNSDALLGLSTTVKWNQVLCQSVVALGVPNVLQVQPEFILPKIAMQMTNCQEDPQSQTSQKIVGSEGSQAKKAYPSVRMPLRGGKWSWMTICALTRNIMSKRDRMVVWKSICRGANLLGILHRTTV